MPYDVRLKTSFNCIVSGASGAGKTTLMKNLLALRDQIFTENPDKVFLFYSHDQPIYHEMLREGLIDEIIDVNVNFPSLDFISNLVSPYQKGNGSFVILDDIMSDLTTDYVKIFCNLSHHLKCSIFLLVQNLFFRNTVFRTLSLNAHYIFLMKNDRDRMQVSSLGRQVCPNNSNFIVKSYITATIRPYDYLLLDFRVDTPNKLRVRSHIFPRQFPMKVYVEN